MRVWIEMVLKMFVSAVAVVTLRVRVWIEIKGS